MSRTELQREADKIDMELHRVLTRVERLERHQPFGWEKGSLSAASRKIEEARTMVRALMHEDDRKATPN